MALTSKLLFKISIVLAVLLASSPRVFAQQKPIGVFVFTVNGPTDLQYLANAAQDAVIGSLVQKGERAVALKKKIDPERLSFKEMEASKYTLVVAGRINIVGQTYRVVLKWVDETGREAQQYLQASDVNQLLPQIETFAKNTLSSTPVEVAEREIPPPAPKPEAVQAEAPKPKAPPVKEVPPPPAPEVQVQAEPPAPQPKVAKQEEPPPSPKVLKEEKKAAKSVIPPAGKELILHDYSTISQRLPFQVRGMGYGDVDGDGSSEVLLTGTRELHVYRMVGGDLQEIAAYQGKSLDIFVKVDVLPGSPPSIVLTNLRGPIAASQILQLSGGSIRPIVENIPYQLRVVAQGETFQLLGESYQAMETTRHQIYELKVAGNRLEVAKKLDLPYDVSLYSFDWVKSPEGEWELLALAPGGKLLYFKSREGKWKKAWSSRETFGGSSNDVPVEVKDVFNEVTADFFILPVSPRSLSSSGPDLVVAKNDSLLKDMIGRKPVISDGRLYRLKWDQLGFTEVWESKRVDGSIADYRVTSSDGQVRLLAAVRLRNPGLFGDMAKNDSVLLVYNLN